MADYWIKVGSIVFAFSIVTDVFFNTLQVIRNRKNKVEETDTNYTVRLPDWLYILVSVVGFGASIAGICTKNSLGILVCFIVGFKCWIELRRIVVVVDSDTEKCRILLFTYTGMEAWNISDLDSVSIENGRLRIYKYNTVIYSTRKYRKTTII